MPVVAAGTHDDAPIGTLWARIPEPLDEAARRAKYDDPLARALAEDGIEHTIRGFSIPPDANHHLATVGIEVRVPVPESVALVAQSIADLGAPLSTILELETDKASVQLTLGEAEGR